MLCLCHPYAMFTLLLSPMPHLNGRGGPFGDTPSDTPSDTPHFRGHSRGHSGPEGPERLLYYEADYPLEAPERPKNQSHSKVGQK